MNRYRKTLFTAIIVFLVGVRTVRSEDYSKDLGLFANAKEIFRPLIADPREIQMSMRLTTPVSQSSLGDVALGDYFGLYRWALPWQDSYVQWSIAGGMFARFDLVVKEKDSQVIDYMAEMPLDIRVGRWSFRLLPYHISSHLGDDYIKRTGILPQKYTFDSFKWLAAYEPCPSLRLYGGANYTIRFNREQLGHYALQTGAEWTSGPWAHDHAQTFFASDFQSWERVGWNPETSTQLGVRIARHAEDKQALAIFVEYGAGNLSYGQFFQQKESHWILGMRFDIP